MSFGARIHPCDEQHVVRPEQGIQDGVQDQSRECSSKGTASTQSRGMSAACQESIICDSPLAVAGLEATDASAVASAASSSAWVLEYAMLGLLAVGEVAAGAF